MQTKKASFLLLQRYFIVSVFLFQTVFRGVVRELCFQRDVGQTEVTIFTTIDNVFEFN